MFFLLKYNKIYTKANITLKKPLIIDKESLRALYKDIQVVRGVKLGKKIREASSGKTGPGTYVCGFFFMDLPVPAFLKGERIINHCFELFRLGSGFVFLISCILYIFLHVSVFHDSISYAATMSCQDHINTIQGNIDKINDLKVSISIEIDESVNGRHSSEQRELTVKKPDKMKIVDPNNKNKKPIIINPTQTLNRKTEYLPQPLRLIMIKEWLGKYQTLEFKNISDNILPYLAAQYIEIKKPSTLNDSAPIYINFHGADTDWGANTITVWNDTSKQPFEIPINKISDDHYAGKIEFQNFNGPVTPNIDKMVLIASRLNGSEAVDYQYGYSCAISVPPYVEDVTIIQGNNRYFAQWVETAEERTFAKKIDEWLNAQLGTAVVINFNETVKDVVVLADDITVSGSLDTTSKKWIGTMTPDQLKLLGDGIHQLTISSINLAGNNLDGNPGTIPKIDLATNQYDGYENENKVETHIGGKDNCHQFKVSIQKPLMTDVTVNPDPTNGANPIITASCTDGLATIAGAEFSLTPDFSSKTEMVPIDGAFNSSNETVKGRLNVESMAEGSHSLYLGTVDSAGNWSDIFQCNFVVSSALSGSNWSEAHHDSARTGFNPGESISLPINLNTIPIPWDTNGETVKPYTSIPEPIITNGYIYIVNTSDPILDIVKGQYDFYGAINIDNLETSLIGG